MKPRTHRLPALRDAQRAETRERILAAAARGTTPANFAQLGFAEVAARAGVSERTVYRHFPTQRALHEAVIEWMERDAGWAVPGLGIDDLIGLPARSFAAFARHGGAPSTELDVVRESRARRHEAIRRAIEPLATGRNPRQARAVACVLQAIASFDTYRKLAQEGGLDAAEAAETASWATRALVEHLRRKDASWPRLEARSRRRR